MIDFATEEKEVTQLANRIEQAALSAATEEAAFKRAGKTLQRTQDAQEILQLVAQAVQQQAHKRIAGVVSKCLESVFEDPYEFKILFERKRGRTEASLHFVRRELDADPLSAAGGGVVDIAAFALRVSCLILHRPRLSKVVILDEPMKFVSSQYQDAVREMLEQLAEDLKIQIVMVSHNENLATGKIVEL
jgi:ABC-type dipeptide/oligopeptide/nickel transport system ATPase subunit